jgi:hypothetical protein
VPDCGLFHIFGDQDRATLRAGKVQARPEVQHAEWSDTDGTLTFSCGRCTMHVGTDTLMVRAEATNEENLRRIQHPITRNLDRFGRRDHLKVNWQRPRPDGVAAAARRPGSRPTMVTLARWASISG